MPANALAKDWGTIEQQIEQRRPSAAVCWFAQNAKSAGVMKGERLGKFSCKLVPQTPDPEIIMPDRNIVQQDNPAWLDLWQPCSKVVAYRVIGVQAIQMKEIYRLPGKLVDCVVEARSKQVREAFIVMIIVLPHVFKNFFAVESGVLLPPPMVDSVAKASETIFRHALAEAEIRITVMGTKLNDQRRLYSRNEICRKREVPRPSAHIRTVAARNESRQR